MKAFEVPLNVKIKDSKLRPKMRRKAEKILACELWCRMVKEQARKALYGK